MDGVCSQPPSASSGDRSLIVDNMNSFLDGEHLITQAQISNRTKTLLAQLNEDVFFFSTPDINFLERYRKQRCQQRRKRAPCTWPRTTDRHNQHSQQVQQRWSQLNLMLQTVPSGVPWNTHLLRLSGKDECSTCHLLSGAEKEEYEQEARRRSFEMDATRLVYTADLQSVSMLPHIEMFREAAFTRRLVALNHLYAPLQRRLYMQTSGIWPQEMATPMIVFLTHDALRQADRIAVWLDNCSYQNKHYLLFQVVRAAVIHRHRLITWITMFPCFEFGSYRFMGTLLVRVWYVFGKHWGMRSGQPCWFGFVTPSHHGTCSDWLIRIVFWIGGRIFGVSSP